ncbi:MAG: hypothetical protein ACHRXM_08935 [Isosphaerales bacterium]
MIAVPRSWLMPAARRQRRTRRTAQPLTEALEARTVLSISITANIDGVMPGVVSLTIPQPTTDRAQDISLVVKPSRGATTLFHDAATEKVIPEAEITLDRIGNGSTETIDLTRVLISSIQFVGAGDIPELKITLVAGQETIGIPDGAAAGIRGGGAVALAQIQ